MSKFFSNFKKGARFIFSALGIFRSEKGYIAGVCQGISERFNFNVTIIRIIWIISTFVTFGTSLIIYLLMVILIPKKPNQNNSFKKKTKYDNYIDVNSKEL